jgi:hypothetical protein
MHFYDTSAHWRSGYDHYLGRGETPVTALTLTKCGKLLVAGLVQFLGGQPAIPVSGALIN